VVPVEVSIGGCPDTDGAGPDGPFYLMTSAAGGRLVNPDWSYQQAPIGDAYMELREESGTPAMAHDFHRMTYTAYLVFAERPDPEKVGLRLVYAPGDGASEPYGG
jgi:hypothetical protein